MTSSSLPVVVNGAPVPGFARSGIMSKSRLTDAIADTQAAGYFGSELKFSRFDAIIVKGASRRRFAFGYMMVRQK